MAEQFWYRSGKHEIIFSSSDFLEQAIDDFLESGANASQMASAIIKVATGLELWIKDYLEQVCPALVLEKIDSDGMQVAKVFKLEKQMRSPKELDTVELKTAPFSVLLNRAEKFLDVTVEAPHLRRLHKIRNALIHHRGTVDVLEVNLLLMQKIFPFVERLSQMDKKRGPRVSKELWQRIREVEKLSVDALSSQLAKKLKHHSKMVRDFSEHKIELLIASAPERSTAQEDLIENGLICPACKQETLAVFQIVEADIEDGVAVGGYVTFSMRCRVCGVELEESEIEHIIEHFADYIGDNEKEKGYWQQAIDPSGLLDSYDM